MDSGIGPPDPLRVGIRRSERLDAALALQLPLTAVPIERHGGHHLSLSAVAGFPAAHVMAARHHAGPDPLGDPRLHHEMSDTRLHAHELPGGNTDAFRVL